MADLAKKLSLLFWLLASLLILLLTLTDNFSLMTIVKRLIIGGLGFGILGGGIGQLIAVNLEGTSSSESLDQSPDTFEEGVTETEAETAEVAESNMESLDFDTVDQTEENIINQAQEAPEEVAEMIKNMNGE